MSAPHDKRFPGETDEYRSARNALLEAERSLRAQVEAVAEQRRNLPRGGAVPEDYVFEEVDLQSGEVRETRLSELFEQGKPTLIIYGFMYGPDWDNPCSSCTSITDSSNGTAPHLRARTNFAVVAKAPPAKLKALAAARGWSKIRLLSSEKNSFNSDYHAEYPGPHMNHHPMINVFTRHDGTIHHFWASELYFVPDGGHPRHADMAWPLWNFLDMTPEGRGEGMPKLAY